MNIIGQYPEIRTYQNGRVEAIRFVLEGGITGAEIEQLMQDNPGYTEMLEHYLTLFVPPVDIEEVVAEKDGIISALGQTLRVVADALPDEQAVNFPNLYPEWHEFIGKTLAKDKRVRHEDGLYRVQQEHVPLEHQPPSVHTAALYTRIQSPGAVQAWVTGQSYAKDVQVTHGGKTWLSMVPNNVWEPGAAGIGDTIWREVPPAGL